MGFVKLRDGSMGNRIRLRYYGLFLTFVSIVVLVFNSNMWQFTMEGMTFYRREETAAGEAGYEGLADTTPARKQRLLPEQDGGDRIAEQLAYIPPNLAEMTCNGTKLKSILVYNNADHPGLMSYPLSPLKPTYMERQIFLEGNCTVNTCRLTMNVSEYSTADVVMFSQHTGGMKYKLPNTRRSGQIWVLYVEEAPPHTLNFYDKVFNWTVNYRPDSDVPNLYGKFNLYDPLVKVKAQSVNYAVNKTKKVAWFVSNCNAKNKRVPYAVELRKHIEVDIYGRCVEGALSCPTNKANECYGMLKRDYKFYLAFENTNCRHYITEKFFENALGNNVLPIVMGARREDYERIAPFRSFIHVDDFESPKALAEYLHKLDKNDTLYNEYFQWKGTGEISLMLNSNFWCRFCTMLHADIPPKSYDDLNAWWRPHGMCTDVTWRNDSKLL